MPQKVKRLVLVDGTSLLYRAYHALPKLQTRDGRPTGAVLGVANMVRRLLESSAFCDAPFFAVVFDAPGGSFRQELYDGYKSQRPEMPEELKVQLPPLKAILEALGLPVIEVEGVEADDVIATLAEQAKEKGFEVVIAASDKDLLQLVDDRVIVVDPKAWKPYDRQAVVEKFGISPEQFPDYLALVGDPVDNIPGIRGIGPKTAVKLLQQFGSLEEIFAHLDEIGGRLGKTLRESRKEVLLWRELAILKRDVPLDLSAAVWTPEALKRRPQDHERLIKLLKELEFSSWLKQLLKEEPKAAGDQLSGHYEALVDGGESWRTWQKKLETASLVALDTQFCKGSASTETASLDPLTAEPVGVALATQEGEAVYLPLKTFDLSPELRRLLADPDKKKVGQNLKFDFHVLANTGIELRGIAHDTMIQSFLLTGGRGNDLETLALRYLGIEPQSHQEVAGEGSFEYACRNADLALRLHHKLWPQIARSEKLRRLYEEIEIPLIEVLARMERAGILLDVEQLKQLSRELATRIEQLTCRIFNLTGERFNLDSPKQLQQVLFEKLKLPVGKKTAKGQPSTSEKVLRSLAHEHEIARLLLEYRHLAKLKSAYVDKLPKLVHPKTGRLHTTFHQTVVITGRLSSSNPNLQNIPIRTEWGRKIRRAFIAPPGAWLLSADYSQIELRIVAHFSGDEKFLEAFHEGHDIHRTTAAEIFGVPEEEVTLEQRRVAKMINFGIIYGISPVGLSEQLGISREEAARYITRYFERHPKVKTFTEALVEEARRKGYAETLFGRRISLPDLTSPRPMHRQAAERLAINAPIQGTAAEIIKKAMIAVDRWLKESGKGKLLLQVHDELLLEVPESSVFEVETAIRHFMEGAVKLTVPLQVVITTAPHWDMGH